jgi:hypothetical protein
MLECIKQLKKVNYTIHYCKLRILDFNAKNSDHCVTTAHILSADYIVLSPTVKSWKKHPCHRGDRPKDKSERKGIRR